jgi:hypothetical protein
MTGQATGFRGHHEADPPQRDGGHQFLKAGALALLPRLPEVGSNDVDPWCRPAEVDGPLDQGLLIPLAFEMGMDLRGR